MLYSRSLELHLFLKYFILFLAALGLHCCTQAFSSCGVRASHCSGFSCCGARALGARASVVVARGLSSCGSRALECWLSSCGPWASLLRGMWDLPRPALAGRFLATAPPGKSELASGVTETLYQLIDSSFPLPSAPGNHCSIFCFYLTILDISYK